MCESAAGEGVGGSAEVESRAARWGWNLPMAAAAISIWRAK